MSETTINQSGNLATLVPVQIFGNYLIEGQGVTVTTSPLLDISALTTFTIQNGAELQLGTGIELGLLDAFTIASGGTLDVGANINLLSNIAFADNGQGEELIIGPGVSPLLLSGVSGFSAGDSIDFQGAGAPTGAFSTFSIGPETDYFVTLQSGLVDSFLVNGEGSKGTLSVGADNAGGFILSDDAPCYAAGTAILTTEGEVLVEHLTTDDIAVLADGTTAPITFIGRRRLNLTRHPRPETARPVRIQPGALGDGVPARQLTLSPDHALFIDGVLVQAKDLIDNATIFQDNAVSEIEYFHVELPTHGILLAEGAPAESFLNTGNRGLFDNGGEALILHPDLMQMRREAESAAPLCHAGPRLAAIRARLQTRGKKFGLTAVETLALAARANHHALTPIVNARAEVIFAIPRDATELLITTPTFTPADFDPASADRRKLGLAIAAILVDGQPMAPESLALSGLHPRAPADTHAWTAGPLRLKLPHNTRRVELRLAGRPKNWHFNPKAA